MLSSSTIPQTTHKPPRRFRPAGNPLFVHSVTRPTFAQTKGNIKGAKGKGIRYQDQVTAWLDDTIPEEWVGVPGPWFQFWDRKGTERYAQADWLGICFARGLICIAEVKLSRVPDAWWQLNRLYLPLVQQLFPAWDIALLEIASKVYHFSLPEEVKVIRRFDDIEPGRTVFMQVPYGTA